MTIRRLIHPTTTRRTVLASAAASGIAFGAAGVAAAGPPPPDYPEITDFCSAYVVVEQAAAFEDWETVAAGIAGLAEHGPDSVAGAVAVLGDALVTFEFETPEFDAAYNEVVDAAVDECGFSAVEVALVDYAFGGIPEELPAGFTVFRAENIGEEVHELILFGFNEGVELTIEEWLGLPDEEAEAVVHFAGAAVVFPGSTGSFGVELTPGRYVAICFLPEGAAPELIAQLPPGPPDPTASYPPELAALFESAPHFVHGMVQEFTVTEG